MCEQRNAALVRMTLGERGREAESSQEFGLIADSCAASCGGRDWPELGSVDHSLVFARVFHMSFDCCCYQAIAITIAGEGPQPAVFESGSRSCL